MRFKHRKWANPFFIVSLAIAGLFGASAFVMNKQSEETPMVEKAEATASGSHIMHVDTRTFSRWQESSAYVGVYFFNTDSDNAFSDFTQSHNNGVYEITVPGASNKTWNKCIVLRKGASGKDWNNVWNRYPADGAGGMTIGTYNSIKITDWNAATMVNRKYVYFTNNYSWSSCHLHAWGSKDFNTTWPGYVMDEVCKDRDNRSVYRSLIPADCTSIIFNDYKDNDTKDQTKTITITSGTLNNLNAWYITGGNSKDRTVGTWTIGTVDSGQVVYLNYNNDAVKDWWTVDSYPYAYFFDERDGNPVAWSAKGHIIYEKGTSDRLIEFVVPGSGQHFLGVIFVRNKTDTPSFNAYNQSTNYYPGFCYKSNNVCNACVLSSNKYGETSYYPDFANSYDLLDTARADFYGVYFCAQERCSGTSPGSITNNDWTNLTTEFNAMPTAIKTIVTNKTGMLDGDDDHLATAVYRYDFIIRKYGKTSYPDFMGRIAAGKLSASVNSFSPFNLLINDENGFSTLIIIIASSISLLSITALSVLMVKKRKRKEY